MTGPRHPRTRRLTAVRGARGEGGFTLVEVLVAAAILAIALAGLARTFDASRQLTATSEGESEATGIAQREIETALGFAYADTRPTTVAGGPAWTTTAGTIGVDTSAEVAAGSTGLARAGTWTGRAGTSGSVYRYVTWAPGTSQALKRITVAVTSSKLAKPVVLSVYVQDPQVGPGGFTGAQTPCVPGRATCNP